MNKKFDFELEGTIASRRLHQGELQTSFCAEAGLWVSQQSEFFAGIFFSVLDPGMGVRTSRLSDLHRFLCSQKHWMVCGCCSLLLNRMTWQSCDAVICLSPMHTFKKPNLLHLPVLFTQCTTQLCWDGLQRSSSSTTHCWWEDNHQREKLCFGGGAHQTSICLADATKPATSKMEVQQAVLDSPAAHRHLRDGSRSTQPPTSKVHCCQRTCLLEMGKLEQCLLEKAASSVRRRPCPPVAELDTAVVVGLASVRVKKNKANEEIVGVSKAVSKADNHVAEMSTASSHNRPFTFTFTEHPQTPEETTQSLPAEVRSEILACLISLVSKAKHLVRRQINHLHTIPQYFGISRGASKKVQ